MYAWLCKETTDPTFVAHTPKYRACRWLLMNLFGARYWEELAYLQVKGMAAYRKAKEVM